MQLITSGSASEITIPSTALPDLAEVEEGLYPSPPPDIPRLCGIQGMVLRLSWTRAVVERLSPAHECTLSRWSLPAIGFDLDTGNRQSPCLNTIPSIQPP
jgi:hypothetical protein